MNTNISMRTIRCLLLGSGFALNMTVGVRAQESNSLDKIMQAQVIRVANTDRKSVV